MNKLTVLDWVAMVLVIIGGLNWGLVAMSPSYDLVAGLFGGTEAIIAKIVYGLVGIAAIYLVFVVAKLERSA